MKSAISSLSEDMENMSFVSQIQFDTNYGLI